MYVVLPSGGILEARFRLKAVNVPYQNLESDTPTCYDAGRGHLAPLRSTTACVFASWEAAVRVMRHLIVADETRVLVDCGLSGRETLKRIQEVGEDPYKLSGIVVTHEHGDHAGGLASHSRSCWILRSTFRSQPLRRATSATASSGFSSFRYRLLKTSKSAHCNFIHSRFHMTPSIRLLSRWKPRGKKLAMAVDLGYINALAAERFRARRSYYRSEPRNRDAACVASVYPWSLKQRDHEPNSDILQTTKWHVSARRFRWPRGICTFWLIFLSIQIILK